MPSGKGTSRAKRAALVPGYCEICGHVRRVTKHRIRPGREGGAYELGNVIGLCLNCHDDAERVYVTRDILYAIVKRRIDTGRIEFILDDLASLAQQMILRSWLEKNG